MADYALAGGAYRYRPLRLTDPHQRGWDIYALQSALKGIAGYALDLDGVFGKQTDAAVKLFQERRVLTVDAIAGVATQRELCRVLIRAERALPDGLLNGMVEKESGYILGNHTPVYPNGSRDVGVVQRNTMYAVYGDAFHAKKSLDLLSERLRTKNIEYDRLGVITSERRLWELAAGSWNAPAWTDRLAKGLSLSDYQSAWIEAYIDRVTAYMVV